MQQVRAVTLSSYLDVASVLGIDGNKLLAEANIKRSDLLDSEALLPAGAVVRLLERSARAAHCDSFGLRMAQSRTFASLGPLSLLLQHLKTVRDVVDAAISFGRTLSDVAFVSLEKGHDVSLINLELVPRYRKSQAADLVVGLGFLMLQGASGGRWTPEAVHFTHQTPTDRSTFEAFFRVPLEFGSSFNGLSCATESLHIQLPLADHSMADNAWRLLRTISLRAEHAPLSEHTKEAIVLLLPSGRATLEAVAARLDHSARSLQRSLEVEGCTFGGLLNDVRRELATHYLAGPQSLTEISDQLGYATPSSFTRWFQHEFGTSPSGWREAQRNAAAGPPPMWKV